jgi:hypothetical protein
LHYTFWFSLNRFEQISEQAISWWYFVLKLSISWGHFFLLQLCVLRHVLW